MKPITDIATFLKRFNNFKDAEIRSIEILSATTIKIIFATQDAARGYDWLTIELEFSGVIDAKIIEESKLNYVDMQDGISLYQEDKKVGFSIGEYKMSTLQDSVSYILASSVKYNEGQF